MKMQAQTINTIAGSTAGFAGDGNNAVLGQLDHPFNLCTDNAGNIYIADRGNGRIRMISSSGIISTIAGTGNAGYNGDNIQATSADLNDPIGVAADLAGNVYIVDKNNNRVRKVNSSGIISTIAGMGNAAYSGDGGLANLAELNAPRGVAVDADGNVYITDQANHRIRKINSAGIITTIAGTGTAGYSGDGGWATAAQLNNPANICFDSHGNILIADVDNERIRKIDNAGTISTIAGTGASGYSGDNGPAIAAQLDEPISVATDNMDRIYIGDGWNNRVRMINTAGIITTVAGDGTAGYSGDGGAAIAAELHFPYGVAVDINNNLCIADYENHRIRRITNPSGVREIIRKAGIGIYPNPSRGCFTLIVPEYKGGEVSVVISSMGGMTVKEITVADKGVVQIESDLPNGIYILSVMVANAVWHEKVEVQ